MSAHTSDATPEAPRLARVIVSGELVEDGLRTGNVVRPCRVTVGLPEGARLQAAWVKVPERSLVLLFSHGSFPPVPERGAHELRVTVTEIPPAHAELLAALKEWFDPTNPMAGIFHNREETDAARARAVAAIAKAEGRS